MPAVASPEIVLAGRPTTEWASDARAGGAEALFLIGLAIQNAGGFVGVIRESLMPRYYDLVRMHGAHADFRTLELPWRPVGIRYKALFVLRPNFALTGDGSYHTRRASFARSNPCYEFRTSFGTWSRPFCPVLTFIRRASPKKKVQHGRKWNSQVNCTLGVRQRNWGQFCVAGKIVTRGSGVWGEGAVSPLAPLSFVEAAVLVMRRTAVRRRRGFGSPARNAAVGGCR